MNNIKLKIPTEQELSYRKEWMKDPNTMAYNAGYNLQLSGYDNKTGCIEKTDLELKQWLKDWTRNPQEKYVLFIYETEQSNPIGEVYCYYNEQEQLHNLGIIIKKEYRNNDYGYLALKEFVAIVFNKLEVNTLSDYIPITREEAIKTFMKAGFVKTQNYKSQVKFNKEEISVQLLLTRK